MPTTIYDSSLLTHRRRDKIIAQQVRNANISGNLQIITPQTGYGSYTLGEQSNGAITYFRKDEGCTSVNVSCNCSVPAVIVPPLNPPRYTLQIVINPGDSLTIGIGLNGSGTIYWGDSTSEPFDTMGDGGGIVHTYSEEGEYTIVIATYITKLVTYNYRQFGEKTNWLGYEGPWPNVVSAILENPEGLTLLCLNNPTLQSVIGLNQCINLTVLQLNNNSINIDEIQSLLKIEELSLEDKPNLIGELNLTFLRDTLQNISISGSPVTSIKNLSGFSIISILDVSNTTITGTFDISSLDQLFEFRCSNTPINDLGILPTSLTTLDINSTSITGTFNISSLDRLFEFICSNTSINNLGTLPTSLTFLDIKSTSITGTFNISSLVNLKNFICSTTTINDLGTLPTSLTNLDINNTSITGTFNISSLVELTNFICSTTTINDLGTLPTSLTNLDINSTSITGTFDISSLDQLIYFDCSTTTINDLGTLPTSLKTLFVSNTTINDLGTLPTSLTVLDINSTSITGTFDISLLSDLSSFVSISNNISSFGLVMPSELTEINMNSCNLSESIANDIGSSLVANGKSYGTINISNQNPLIVLDIDNPPWSTLDDREWTLTL